MNQKKKSTQKTAFEDAVKKACDGLFYPSETDAEMVPFFAGGPAERTPDAIATKLGLKAGTAIEERSFADFFSRLTTIREWYGSAETKNAKRFLKLQKLLEENLENLTVIRAGRIQIDIFAVGTDGNGNLMGIRTKAVET